MYDNFIETDEILEIYGNPNDFKLGHILDPSDTEEDDINLVHQSPYHSIDGDARVRPISHQIGVDSVDRHTRTFRCTCKLLVISTY